MTSAKLSFNPEHLETELRGADVFVNTYWIRQPYGHEDFQTAVRNNRILVDAAVRARVGRFVHVSVSNASLDSPLGYYRGKAEVDAVGVGAGQKRRKVWSFSPLVFPAAVAAQDPGP